MIKIETLVIEAISSNQLEKIKILYQGEAYMKQI